MTTINRTINGQEHELDVPSDMPLLWVLRDKLNLTGTMYGCGIGTCGTCTVLVDGVPMQSCIRPASRLAGRSIMTIERLDPSRQRVVQRAWNDENVPQCGYCQGGQILAARALLRDNPE